jgi:hypothetical protein
MPFIHAQPNETETQRRQRFAQEIDPEVMVRIVKIQDLGYLNPCDVPNHGMCAVRIQLFNAAIVAGMAIDGIEQHWDYWTVSEALDALRAWDGSPDPPGNWIKTCDKQPDGKLVERRGPGSGMQEKEP